MGTEQQLTRWAERFNVLLYRPIPHNPHNSLHSEADLSINCGQATRQDIKQASGQMKSGKAAGQDGIPTEAMKADIYASVEMFILYLERSGKRRRYRMIGRRDILSSSLKKGDLSNCANC